MNISGLPRLDVDDPRPAVRQIERILRRAIAATRFAPGDQLPGQHQLAAHFEVCRETVRRALGRMQDVTEAHGTAGTFVRVLPPAQYVAVFRYPDDILEDSDAMFFTSLRGAVVYRNDRGPGDDRGRVEIYRLQPVSESEIDEARQT